MYNIGMSFLTAEFITVSHLDFLVLLIFNYYWSLGPAHYQIAVNIKLEITNLPFRKNFNDIHIKWQISFYYRRIFPVLL